MTISKYAKAKGRIKKTRFIMMRYDIFDSPAYRSLSAKSMITLLIIQRRFCGYNNGEIGISCREIGQFLKVSKDTANKAIEELINAKLITVTQESGFNMKCRTSRRFALTFEAIGNTPASNEWKNFINQSDFKSKTVLPQRHKKQSYKNITNVVSFKGQKQLSA